MVQNKSGQQVKNNNNNNNLDSSSSFGQEQSGFCGKLENYFSFYTIKITKISQLKYSWSSKEATGNEKKKMVQNLRWATAPLSIG